MTVNLSENSVKVPKPNITNDLFGKTKPKNSTQQKRNYNRPHVGIIKLPEISKTPIYDSFIKKKSDFPKTKYVFSNPTRKIGLLIKGIASIAIVTGGLCALFKSKK